MNDSENASVKLEINSDDPKIVSICKQYWAADQSHKFPLPTSEIAKNFGLSNIDLNRIVKTFSTMFWLKLPCKTCGVFYVFENRTDYTKSRRLGENNWDYVCLECKESEQKLRREQEQIIREQRSIILHNRFDLSKHKPVDLNLFSLTDAIYLIAMIRGGALEDFSAIHSLEQFRERLSPSSDMDSKILAHLEKRGILRIHPISPHTAFIWDEIEFKEQYYSSKVWWGYPVGGEQQLTLRNVASELERRFRERDWLPHWHEEWLRLWRQITLAETLQYFDYQMRERRFEFNPGEKTLDLFIGLLEEYSLGQIFRMIYAGARGSADYFQRGGVSRSQAANSTVTRIKNYAERAEANGWSLEPYFRLKELPQSLVSQVMFRAVFKLDEKYLSIPATEDSASLLGL
jgi:hypothetical protein